MGHYPCTAEGNNCLLVFTDTFTKQVKVKEPIFLRNRVCDKFITDNGLEFDNKDVTKLLDEYSSSHTLIPPGRARANPAERTNRVIKTQIIAFIEEKHSEWDKHIYELIFANYTAVHESTTMAPAFIDFERHSTPPKSLQRLAENA